MKINRGWLLFLIVASAPATAGEPSKLTWQASVALRYESIEDDAGRIEEIGLDRVSLEARGALTPRLKYRAQADVSGKSVRDLWMSYDLTSNWLVKLGQHTVPFGLARFVGSPYRIFTELSPSANQFEVPRGRGLGAQLEGHGNQNQWSVELGAYDGRGPLVARTSEANGYLLGARAAIALAGEVVEQPTPFEQRPSQDLVIGFGLMKAKRNTQRDWAFGRMAPGEVSTTPANFTSVTADIFWRSGALHASSAAFARSVHPEGFRRYTDLGYEIQAGWVFTRLAPNEWELVLRTSQLLRDADRKISKDPDLQNETGIALNWYQKGHRLKTQFNVLRRNFRQSGESETYFILQQQFRL